MVFVGLMAFWVISVFIILFDFDYFQLINDFGDRFVYFERGSWILNGPPIVSEYPQVPTFLFGFISEWAFFQYDLLVYSCGPRLLSHTDYS